MNTQPETQPLRPQPEQRATLLIQLVCAVTISRGRDLPGGFSEDRIPEIVRVAACFLQEIEQTAADPAS